MPVVYIKLVILLSFVLGPSTIGCAIFRNYLCLVVLRIMSILYCGI